MAASVRLRSGWENFPARRSRRQPSPRQNNRLILVSLSHPPGAQGVSILKVDPDGLGAEKGLSAGDVILSVANQPVNSSADVHNAIAQAEKTGKRDVLMRIKTENDRIEFVALPLPAQAPSLWGRIQSWIRLL
jgi:S1-C subfamily serine protease